MPRLAPVFAAVATVAGIISVHLWQQLRAERLRNVELQQRVAQLEPGAPAAAGASASAPALASAGGSVPAANAAPGTAPAAPPAPAAAARPNAPVMINSADLMKDPDYREGMHASMRASIGQNYPDLARELGLDPAQAGKLLDLLTAHQVSMMANALPVGAGPDAIREFQQKSQETRRKQEAEISALLGESKDQQWKDYTSSLQARRQVGNLRTALESSGEPLDEQTARQLVTALAAEQKQQQEAMRAMAAARDPSAPRDQVAMMEENLRLTEEGNRNNLSVASSYLSSAQLEVLRKMQNQSLSLTRAFLRAQREQAEGAQASAAPASGAAPPAGQGAAVINFRLPSGN